LATYSKRNFDRSDKLRSLTSLAEVINSELTEHYSSRRRIARIFGFFGFAPKKESFTVNQIMIDNVYLI